MSEVQYSIREAVREFGEENEGFHRLVDFFASGRVNAAAQAVGTAQAALDH
ncbi:hypothetical protein [Halomicrococcus sp. NG-SE-24]|uniref:hypothetical protein n=1 Tax=Halomicrococcus sp. NG-SE-24 TaxID=3436928 RepID=UPI003D97CE7B